MKKAGLSVCDYFERLWDKDGDTQRVIDKMVSLGVLNSATRHICEIGTGSGRYLEKVLQICNPKVYESYETAADWKEYLTKTYKKVIPRDADGMKLSHTESSVVDLVYAHGVFVYLPFLVSYSYFTEIARVTRGGYVCFDMMSEDCIDEKSVKAWFDARHFYPHLLSKSWVRGFLGDKGFTEGDNFFNGYGPGVSNYMVFQMQKVT